MVFRNSRGFFVVLYHRGCYFLLIAYKFDHRTLSERTSKQTSGFDFKIEIISDTLMFIVNFFLFMLQTTKSSIQKCFWCIAQ